LEAFSQASEASISASNGPVCELCGSASRIPTVDGFSLSTGLVSRVIPTCQNCEIPNLSTFSQAVSPARISATRAREQGSTGHVRVFGPSTPDSFANFDPATSSWRTSQLSLLEDSGEFSGTWPRAGMTRNGIAYRLRPLAPLTGATESGLLPTPEASNTKAQAMRTGGRPPRDFLKPIWRTSNAHNGSNRNPIDPDQRISEGRQVGLVDQVGGSLNPAWVEWLMGFPLGWTDCEDSATPSSPRSPNSSVGESSNGS
jgi:hypothetical protein